MRCTYSASFEAQSAVSIFEAAIDVALDRLTPQQADAAGLMAARDRLAREIGHLVDAFGRGGDPPSLVAELRTREARKADLDRRPPALRLTGSTRDHA